MHPERVLSIVYAGQAPLLLRPEAPVEPAATTEAPPSEVEVFAKAVDEGRDLGEYLFAVTPADKQPPTAAQAKALAKLLFGGKDVRAFAAAGRSFPQLAVAVQDLQRCKAPALFLHGSEESATVKAADWSTAVPNETVLLGMRLFAQGAHLVTGANPAGALMSGGQALVLGR